MGHVREQWCGKAFRAGTGDPSPQGPCAALPGAAVTFGVKHGPLSQCACINTCAVLLLRGEDP